MPVPTIALVIGREPELRYSLHRGYVDAVWAAGAMPVVLAPPPAGEPLDRFVDYVTSCSGLMLTGGGDIGPGAYGEAPSAPLMAVDPMRDAAELAATQAALEAGLPVLGICRGLQLLAVVSGGTLHQDLTTAGFTGHHWDEERQHETVHGVEACAGSLAASVLPADRLVNSIHHQAVKTLGADLLTTAVSEDGVVEAVEGDRVLGLQWHPERLFSADRRHLAPFRWLVEEAA